MSNINKEIMEDLIPQTTINRIKKSNSITEIVIIKLNVDLNKNFDKEQKQFIRGYASRRQDELRDKLFS